MKFKQYLEEAKKYVSKKDLPDWVKRILKQKKIGKEIMVEIGTNVNIGSNWHDANVKEIFGYDKGKVSSVTAIGTMQLGDTKKDIQAKKGFKTKLNPDRMILVTNTYPKSATLYVHPDAVIKALEPEVENELSKEEIMLLFITRGLKPSFRRQEAASYGIDYNSVSQTLINKGYLMKNKAINKKGKNYLLTFEKGKHMQDHEVADKLGIKRAGY